MLTLITAHSSIPEAYLIYLPHFAFPLAASNGDIPRAQEENKMAAVATIAKIFFITEG